MITFVYPLRDSDIEALRKFGGVEYWQYDGIMTRSAVELPGMDIDVWLFEFDNVADDYGRERMVSVVMGKLNKTRDEALEYLRNELQAIPCHLVRLVERMPE